MTDDNDLRIKILSSLAKMIDLASEYDKALDFEYGHRHFEDSEVSDARLVLMQALAMGWDK